MQLARSPLRGPASLLASALVVGFGTISTSPSVEAAALRGSPKSYSVSYNNDKTVTRWNPCIPIHYRTNLRYAPSGALDDVRTAVTRIAAATGLRFVYDGSTTVIPQQSYGSSFTIGAPPPLVIAWAAPGTGAGRSNLLTSQAGLAGMGGWRSAWWTDSAGAHQPRIFTGYVVLSTRFKSLPAGFGVGPNRGALLMHELGHAMGLNHTSDRTQIMYPTMGGYASFGAGDTAGLHRIGSTNGCVR